MHTTPSTCAPPACVGARRIPSWKTSNEKAYQAVEETINTAAGKREDSGPEIGAIVAGQIEE